MGYQLIPLARPPLRKCMQCRALKRERFLCRCQACEDANEQHYRAQKAAGVRWPVNENIIGWTVRDTLPGLNDYLLYFFRWIRSLGKDKAMGVPSVPLARPPLRGYQPTSEPAERTPPQEGSMMVGLTAREAVDALIAVFGAGAKPHPNSYVTPYQPRSVCDEMLLVSYEGLE